MVHGFVEYDATSESNSSANLTWVKVQAQEKLTHTRWGHGRVSEPGGQHYTRHMFHSAVMLDRGHTFVLGYL